MSEQTADIPAEEVNGKKKGSSARPLFVLVGIVVFAAALYVFGVRQGRGQIDALRADFESRLAAAEQSLTATRAQLALVMNVTNLRGAEIAILRSAVELDRRNFGTANDQLRTAGAALMRVQDPVGGVALQDVHALGEDMAAFDINVATNLEDQRTRILGFAARLRGMTPEIPAGPPGPVTEPSVPAEEMPAAE